MHLVKMPAEVKEVLAKQKPIPIATATKDGTPNVVFINFMKILDDETLLLSDNFFLKTAANLSENPRISLLCYDAESTKSYQIKGSAKVHKAGPVFEEMRKWVHGVNPKLPAKAAVVVKVEAVYDAIWGPSAGKLIV
ncbi:MAG: pyridoxamine 5'-phosphate oxidase family protein [Methanomassiliicoccales archaeon]|nr:pyridoxamine 5'-phosphate oxidase family protein [Methanomassiliicoccales archaeon]